MYPTLIGALTVAADTECSVRITEDPLHDILSRLLGSVWKLTNTNLRLTPHTIICHECIHTGVHLCGHGGRQAYHDWTMDWLFRCRQAISDFALMHFPAREAYTVYCTIMVTRA